MLSYWITTPEMCDTGPVCVETWTRKAGTQISSWIVNGSHWTGTFLREKIRQRGFAVIQVFFRTMFVSLYVSLYTNVFQHKTYVFRNVSFYKELFQKACYLTFVFQACFIIKPLLGFRAIISLRKLSKPGPAGYSKKGRNQQRVKNFLF